MARRAPEATKDICPICLDSVGRNKGPRIAIQEDPSHFALAGEPATHANMMRCVLYEMWTFASAVHALQEFRVRKNIQWAEPLVYDHKNLGAI